MSRQGRHNALSNGVISDDGERAQGNLSPKLISDCRQNAGNRLAGSSEGAGVVGMGVNYPSNIWHISIDICVSAVSLEGLKSPSITSPSRVHKIMLSGVRSR